MKQTRHPENEADAYCPVAGEDSVSPAVSQPCGVVVLYKRDALPNRLCDAFSNRLCAIHTWLEYRLPCR